MDLAVLVLMIDYGYCCVDLVVVDLVAWILLSGPCRVGFVNVDLVAWIL